MVLKLPMPDRRRRILADGWYSWVVPSFRPLTEVIGHWPRPLRELVFRKGPLRALVLLVAGARYDAIAFTRTDTGWRSLLLLRALVGRRRKLVVLQFIDHSVRSSRAAAIADRLWRPVDRWATRRAVLAAHVLSRSDPARYASAFGVEEGRFRFIPFAWRMQPVGAALGGVVTRSGVVSAGRADCDWPTLFEAARGAGWPLVVVCGEHDRVAVESLNADGRATVLVEIEHDRVRELLRNAAVCVLSIVESPASHGHVRLCDAVDAGAAVVASRVRSLDGYVEDGSTAILVVPGDPAAMRRAIDRLLGGEGLREQFARAAFERAEAWTWDEYLRAIEAFVHGEAVPVPSAVFAGG